MSVLVGNPFFLGAGASAGAAYKVERSLRFNSSDSAYLSRTPASAGNRKTWTLSFWVKRGASTGSDTGLFSTYSGSNPATTGYFNSNDGITFYNYSGSYQFRLITSQVFRDYSAWYHVVFAVDTTQATSSNRVKIYINGSQITTFSTETYPSQNVDTDWNSTTEHQIGNHASYFNGYLADIHFIDGQALTPSSFTEVSATTGQLIPKAYTGSFGTNGFWLKFSDNSAATATTLGKDYSGNSNNWTPNNLSVTAGAGNDSLVDTPTSYGSDTGVGGEVRGNYCTLNPLVNAAYNTYSNGNLECAFPGATTGATAVGTIAVSSGKWYWELNRNDISSGLLAGIARIDTNTLNLIGSNATSYAYKDSNGNKINNGTSTAYGATWSHTNIIGVALDLDAGTLVFYKDGVSQGTAFSGLSGTFYPAFSEDNAGSGSGVAANFGQRPFAFPVSGFKALCDTNLTAPVVAKPSTVMDVKLYTGNGSTQTISGLGFSPDLVWIKTRSAAVSHALQDIVRGTNKVLYSNSTGTEDTYTDALTSFNSDGFSLGAQSLVNNNTSTYVAWTWDAGTSTVTNTQGSITSQVRANASAGFSIVTYSGNSSTATVGHGLNVAPSWIIIKNRTSAYDWIVYANESGTLKQLYLNLTLASSGSGLSLPSSTTFNLPGGGASGSNETGKNYVAYCFAPVAGYSSFGSYTGNSSTDGPFVFCNFRPRWILIKQVTSSGDGWYIYDAQRIGYNPTNLYLWANGSNEEQTSGNFDLLSNGFKLRTTASALNYTGYTYIYAAFAESPFQYARAR